MEGGKTKHRSVLSWADEVEEEEEAAAVQSDLRQNQKPNPFGSARPREVVLRENGIDWRKLDSDLYRPPRFRDGSPAPVLNPNRIKPKSSPGKVLKQSVLLFTPQEQIPMTFVPPLRYPPKIIVGRILENGETNRLSIFANGLQARRHQSTPVSEKENRFGEAEGQNSQHSKSLSPKSQRVDEGHNSEEKYKNTEDENERIGVSGSSRNGFVSETRKPGKRRPGADESVLRVINGGKNGEERIGRREGGWQRIDRRFAAAGKSTEVVGQKGGRGRANSNTNVHGVSKIWKPIQ